jgi:hypothetical protein
MCSACVKSATGKGEIMQIVEDSGLATRILADLAAEMKVEKPLPHLAELIYCLTRSYLDRFEPVPLTPREIVLFAVGVGLEKVLLVGHKQQVQGECEGIHYSVDCLDSAGRVLELKSTRMAASKFPEGLSEGWRKQILGYMYTQSGPFPGTDEATLAIMHIIGGELTCWRIQATREEVVENWQWLQERRGIYMSLVERERVPSPYRYNMDWECGHCRYRMFCEAGQVAILNTLPTTPLCEACGGPTVHGEGHLVCCICGTTKEEDDAN